MVAMGQACAGCGGRQLFLFFWGGGGMLKESFGWIFSALGFQTYENQEGTWKAYKTPGCF